MPVEDAYPQADPGDRSVGNGGGDKIAIDGPIVVEDASLTSIFEREMPRKQRFAAQNPRPARRLRNR